MQGNRETGVDASAQTGRRTFIKTVAAFGAGLAAGATEAAEQTTTSDAIPRRPFGKTGVKVSALGLGGWHIGCLETQEEATAFVREALDAGINFIDNGWEYHDGKSEEWVGSAVEGRRDHVFLATKVCTHGRDKGVAMKQLEESLRRLRTNHLDLWQIHEIIYDNDPEWHFRKGGTIEALDQAKKQGKVRFVGFTGHKDPRIQLKMLAHDYPFDSCQMPLNCCDASFRSFEKHVLPELGKRGIAAIGMKSMGGGRMIEKGAVTPQEALRYAMSLPTATVVCGMDSMGCLKTNLAVARGFQPMTPREMDALRSRCAEHAGDGRYELYKTSMLFDGPLGRGLHGFPGDL